MWYERFFKKNKEIGGGMKFLIGLLVVIGLIFYFFVQSEVISGSTFFLLSSISLILFGLVHAD